MHVERLCLLPRKPILSSRQQHATAISLDKLKIVWRYRCRARRFAGLHCFRSLRQSNCLEDEIAYRKSGAFDRAPRAGTGFETVHGAIDRASAGWHTRLNR